MNTLYWTETNGSTPTILCAVLLAAGVTRVVDIRRTPNHHFANVQGQFLESLFERARETGHEIDYVRLALPSLKTTQIGGTDNSLQAAQSAEPSAALYAAFASKKGEKTRKEALRLLKDAATVCILVSNGDAVMGNHDLNTVLMALFGGGPQEMPSLNRLDSLLPHVDALEQLGLHTGKVYDIREMFSTLNAEYFGGRYRTHDLVLVWEDMPKRNPRRLGYFLYPALIALNPVLDQEIVPQEVAEAVLYHEMIHMQCAHDGLPYGHTVEFFQQESLFKDYAEKFWFDFDEAWTALDAVDP